MIGKTGISALHEWCDKRKLYPDFVLIQDEGGEFVFAVQLNGHEWSRGRGGTKTSARHDAARRALQALLPGVAFDCNGLVVKLPGGSGVDDELAPTLAQRLAIVDVKKRRKAELYSPTTTTSGEENDDEDTYYASRGASVCSALLHAMWQIDETIPEPPVYDFAVCDNPAKALKRKGPHSTPAPIHRASFACTATILIDARSKPQSVNTENERKDSADTDADPNANANANANANESQSTTTDKTRQVKDVPDPTRTQRTNKSTEATAVSGTRTQSQDSEDLSSYRVRTALQKMSAVGTGGTKREARHVASAKLLAMLFPECNGMAEVKRAAEAKREAYAATKAQKMQSKRMVTRDGDPNKQKLFSFLRSKSTNEPTPPEALVQFMDEVLTNPYGHRINEDSTTTKTNSSSDTMDVHGRAAKHTKESKEMTPVGALSADEVSVENLSISEEKGVEKDSGCSTVNPALFQPSKTTEMSRSTLSSSSPPSLSLSSSHHNLSSIRQKQLEDKVLAALELQNDVQESLPDYVGRTVLRVAEPQDKNWILSLLKEDPPAVPSVDDHTECSFDEDESIDETALSKSGLQTQVRKGTHGVPTDDTANEEANLALTSTPSTVVLLLCRAIAPYDEAPLGCAIMTPGFTFTKGRTLEITNLGNGPHFPKERFMECLEAFATNMQCVLVDKTSKLAATGTARTPPTASPPALRQETTTETGHFVLRRNELLSILRDFVSLTPATSVSATTKPSSAYSVSSLQAVQEEEGDTEAEQASDKEAPQTKSKSRDKPNKRSRKY